MKLLIATNNRGKVVEVSGALAGLSIELLTPIDLPYTIVMPKETGASFAENALLKARHFFENARLATVSEDSGIFVEALTGELGLKTRRWGMGPDASDREWIHYFLNRMKGEGNRRASFRSAVAYVDGKGREHIFEGRCDGIITDDIEAPFLPGLPFDACFRPDGFPCVYGALTTEEKNRTSHRGQALLKLRAFLEKCSR